MSIFKCKMCGGTIEFNPGDTVGICDSCGTKQTLPRLDDDRRANLYDRANHFRRNNEFDKAMGIYEQILNEDPDDAEAYWSLVLCRYGIEYVEDPATHKRVPTVNRAQFTSVFDDDNYRSAIQHADSYQKAIYEEEANAINEIQKGILSISQKEEPFDVFICYKETDANGRRTQDSVLANDLYHQLTQEGFKVFFSRITLEDKLGTAYEPYIFAALNSAKAMVVLGTKPEYFNAVWVKNEWSRYLSLVKQSGGKKVLIPAYRDMDPYDLPEEFSHLQAQDMSKLGFMQDLIRGIKKIVKVDEPKQTVKETVVVNNGAAAGTTPLLKRAFMFLEDGEWAKADEFCEQVLNIDPENAQAYLGKLMAELHACKAEDLGAQEQLFDSSINYQKTLRFADNDLSEKLKGYTAHVSERLKRKHEYETYTNAVKILDCATTEEDVHRAIDAFKTIPNYAGVEQQLEACIKKIDEIRIKQESDRIRLAEEQRIAREKRKKENKKIALLASAIVLIVILFNTVVLPLINYKKAYNCILSGDYHEGNIIISKLSKSDEDYFDYLSKITDDLVTDDLIETADDCLSTITFSSSFDMDAAYSKRLELWSLYGDRLLSNAKVGSKVFFGSYEQDNDLSNGQEEIEWIVLKKTVNKMLLISRYALDSQPISDEADSVFWSTCFLRTWLNEDFYNSAFNEDEQSSIETTDFEEYTYDFLSDKKNAVRMIEDKVFQLNAGEVKQYFPEDYDRWCYPTDYCRKKLGSSLWGAPKGYHTCMWWCYRGLGITFRDYYGDYVDYDGDVVTGMEDIGNELGIRPVMWIKTE